MRHEIIEKVGELNLWGATDEANRDDEDKGSGKWRAEDIDNQKHEGQYGLKGVARVEMPMAMTSIALPSFLPEAGRLIDQAVLAKVVGWQNLLK